MDAILILELVKDTVTAKHHKVLLTWLHPKVTDIRVSDYDVLITEKMRGFCLDIAKGSADTETAWKDSVRTKYNLRLLRHGDNRSILVDLPSVLENSVNLDRVCRLVVIRNGQDLATTSD